MSIRKAAVTGFAALALLLGAVTAATAQPADPAPRALISSTLDEKGPLTPGA